MPSSDVEELRSMLRQLARSFVLWSVLVLVPSAAHADYVGYIPGGLGVPPASLASPIIVGGLLVGASGVNVGGTLYDVEFIDLSCVEVFAGCDEDSDFAFQSQADAIAAAHALFDQVWVDSSLGLFDTNTKLTIGCHDARDLLCFAHIPYGIGDSAGYQKVVARNSHVSNQIGVNLHGTLPWEGGFATHAGSRENMYAKFQRVSVPEPSVLFLLGAGLVGLVYIRRTHSALRA